MKKKVVTSNSFDGGTCIYQYGHMEQYDTHTKRQKPNYIAKTSLKIVNCWPHIYINYSLLRGNN